MFPRGDGPKHFITSVKQHGGLLAKGRLLGVQFSALFTDNLYFQICRHGVEMAAQIREDLLDKGYRLYLDSPTNQLFVVWPDSALAELARLVSFSRWEKFDKKNTVIRLATSWATTQKAVDQLKKIL